MYHFVIFKESGKLRNPLQLLNAIDIFIKLTLEAIRTLPRILPNTAVKSIIWKISKEDNTILTKIATVGKKKKKS